MTLPLRVDIWAMQPNGFRIEFSGAEGGTYEVQRSADLKTWTRLGDATALEFGQFEYVDTAVSTNSPPRFYRIKD